MKKNFTLLSLFCFVACNTGTKNMLPEISDSFAMALIKTEYTAQNNLDGAEFATVDSLTILQKTMHEADSTCTVQFHINCSYQSAAMPPGYGRTPPAINTDTMITLRYHGQWMIKN
jgi:hypothetical protein